MLIAFKALGATCLAGALATSGVITTGTFADNNDGPASATLVSDPHATFQALAVGEEAVVPADAAGSVTVKRTETGLEVAAVTPNAQWSPQTKTLAPDWILVTFEGPGQRVDLALDMVGEQLRIRTASFDIELEEPTTTTTVPETTTTTEAPTTTTTAPPPPPVTSPPPVQPTVIPVAGAGSVVIVLQGPIVVVQKIKVVPGWVAAVERYSGDVRVVFRKGDRLFRFDAAMFDRRLRSEIRELRSGDGDRDGDRDWWDRDWDRERDGDRDGRGDGDRDGRRDGRRGDGDRDGKH